MAVGGTTGWWRSSAASRPRGSASPWGSTASSWPSQSSGAAPADEPVPIAVVVGADPSDTAGRLAIATQLRATGLAVRADLTTRRLGRQLEAAVREGAHFAVILGDELAAGDVGLRDLDGASQKLVPLADLAPLLRRKVPGG